MDTIISLSSLTDYLLLSAPDGSSTSNTSKKNTKKTTVKTVKKYHKVRKGETIWTIAVRYYKDGKKFTKIAKANKLPIITKKGKKTCKLKVGQKLIIP